MSWEDYEIKVQNLLRGKLLRWFPYLPDDSVKVYGKRIIPGSKGTYEIDVSAEVNLGELKLLFIVECKHWANRVPQDVVLSLKSKLEDLGAHKGIIVSKGGFQKGAIRIARGNGIALWHYTGVSTAGFDPLTLTVDWEATISEFESKWLRRLRGVKYNPRPWRFRDNNLALSVPRSVLMSNIWKIINSFWPIWILELTYGSLRRRRKLRPPSSP
jgi:hypothetical protein